MERLGPYLLGPNDTEENGIYCGDCLELMPHIPENSIDSIITDPPYALEFMGKEWDKIIPGVEYWRAALRVAKPGATLLAFGGTRTHHRLMCNIEDAGWIIRDVIMWVYGSGFPKSHDISKAIDKAAGAEREVVGVHRRGTSNAAQSRGTYNFRGRDIDNQSNKMEQQVNLTAPATPAAKLWHGYGTALKPAWEPIIVAMKPLDGTFANNALKWGVAGLWVDGGRIPGSSGNGHWTHKREIGGRGIYGGGGYEDIDNGNQGHIQGRWPANLIHDGSDEVVGLFPITNNSARPNAQGKLYSAENGVVYHSAGKRIHNSVHNDQGSAARFFYCAKASRKERGEGNNHPTVKPLSLMRYLCRLTRTPTGGIVLDTFCGSGTTAVAAKLEHRLYICFDNVLSYCVLSRNRARRAQLEPEQTRMEL